jgi:squalene-hopene/tetraprenyl-beta-curcumene cyclase
MKAIGTVLCLSLSVEAARAQEAFRLKPEIIAGFVERHCKKCHGANEPKADLRLDNVRLEIGRGDSAEVWRRVLDALRDGEMPPESEPRPDAQALKAVVDHLAIAVSRSTTPIKPFPQYKTAGIEIPHATADEPTLKRFNQEAAVKYLDDGAVAWVRSYGCITCHTSGNYMAERPGLTGVLGPPREEVFKNFADAVYDEPAYKGDFWFVWRTLGLAEWDKHVSGELSAHTENALREMLVRQQDNGAWDIAERRIQIPHVISEFELAVQAARAIAAAPGWLDNLQDDNLRRRVERLKTYFRGYQPRNDYELALLLRIDTLLPGVVSPELRRQSMAVLRSRQQDDGGWSTRRMSDDKNWSVRVDPRLVDTLQSKPDAENPGSDAYMTAFAIVLLREAGVPAADEQVRQGIAWLKRNQRQSGRWWMESLTFPGENRRHFTTYIATAQALRALNLCGELEPAVASQE